MCVFKGGRYQSLKCHARVRLDALDSRVIIHSFISSFVSSIFCRIEINIYVLFCSIVMAHDKILFERSFVFIKERLPQNELRTNKVDEITGIITVFENERGKFFRFKPFGLEDTMTDDWALVSGGHSIISYKKSTNDRESILVSSNPLLKYRFCFNINQLRSVRRHHMLPGIAHMVFVLKDGSTLPAFHFKTGGSKELLQLLYQYLRLEK